MPEFPAIDTKPLLTVGDVALLLGISTDTVRRWAIRGRIPCIALPSGHRRFRREDVLPLLSSAEERAEQLAERRSA